MPIGTSRIGVLGAGTVPGGSCTFNAPGTFKVPPGVKNVSITGKGGSGNPGNAGNSGNSGNPGSGGGGGGGGGFCNSPVANPGGRAIAGRNGCLLSTVVPGGCRASPFTSPGQSGSGGNSGNAGTAGSAGSAGNTGTKSSGLSKCFNGGAGGNAGTAGGAGNGGSGGGGGGGGNGGNSPGNGGAGGTGGGSGGPGFRTPTPISPPCGDNFAGGGGGGAGATNDGASSPTSPIPFPGGFIAAGGRGGLSNTYSFPLSPVCIYVSPGCIPTNITGGCGASGSGNVPTPCGSKTSLATRSGLSSIGCLGGNARRSANLPSSWYTPIPETNPQFPAIRSGGGGGAGQITHFQPNGPCRVRSGGGGGGGRGNAGNAGSTGGAGGTGAAATPSTFNCVPVTPGCSYPISVGSPGGQIVISWNPQ